MTQERVAPTMPEGRRAVIYALRRRGQATADDIARQLDMTVSGARQHLTALVEEGFAEATELPRPKGQRGRAQLSYTVTDRADALFPKAYGELTNELLGYASESDSGLVDTLFARRDGGQTTCRRDPNPTPTRTRAARWSARRMPSGRASRPGR